jgi:hypothetical protein
LDHAINLIIFAILTLAGLVMEGIGFVDGGGCCRDRTYDKLIKSQLLYQLS